MVDGLLARRWFHRFGISVPLALHSNPETPAITEGIA